MRALDPEVMDAMWAAAEPLLPCRGDDHPLGCHNPRIPDRVCFDGIVIRLVTGCSWVTAERLIAHQASDTTLRARRDEWADAGVFDALADEALRAYDRIVGLDLTETAVDGSIHKAPCGGDGTGKSPVDRGKSGWKWSLLTDRNGIPVSWAADGANRNDITLFEPTVAAGGASRRGDPAFGPRLRLRRRQGVRGQLRHRRRRVRQETQTGRRSHQDHSPAGTALGHRAHQLVAVELRAATPQHRPPATTPTRPTRPRDRVASHRQTQATPNRLDIDCPQLAEPAHRR